MKLLNIHTTKIYTLFLTLVSSILVTRSLGPTGRGEYSYIFNLIIIIITMGNSGIYQRFPYFLKEKKYSLEKLVGITLIHLFSIFTIILIAIFIFKLPFYLFLIFSLISSYLLNGLLLIKDEKARNFWSVTNFTVYVLILIYMYINKNNNISYFFYAMIFKEGIFAFGGFLTLKEEIFSEINKVLKKENLKGYLNYLKYSAPLMVGEILVILNFKADLFVLRKLLPFEKIGYYTLALTVSNLTLGLLEGFSDKLYSKLHRCSLEKEINKILKINFLISLGVYLILVLTGKFLITKVYGENFLESYYLLIILFLSNFPAIAFKIFYSGTYLKKSHWKINSVLFLGIVINLTLNYILVPKFGILVPCYISIISYTFVSLGIKLKS